ncbi:MAG TPA: alpha-ketoglutarate-dependent dioxygenase AlkB, partial [Gammaproteobacteria bacterium]|nr:alpha-ketoglutarate-dependent dioxygenase AlkB [Gammaproteobacteria bacterium]
MSRELFARDEGESACCDLAPGAVLLRGFALPAEAELKHAVAAVAASAPFRHMTTPGGFTMSVAMTNCGRLGWVSSERGYRYAEQDPECGTPWPAMPGAILDL